MSMCDNKDNVPNFETFEDFMANLVVKQGAIIMCDELIASIRDLCKESDVARNNKVLLYETIIERLQKELEGIKGAGEINVK